MSAKGKPRFNRILLKLSGEVFLGAQKFGIDPEFMAEISSDIAAISQMGVQTAIVIGGGNFLRGIAEQEKGVNRVIADVLRDQEVDLVRIVEVWNGFARLVRAIFRDPQCPAVDSA